MPTVLVQIFDIRKRYPQPTALKTYQSKH